jgi:hypothetical protein
MLTSGVYQIFEFALDSALEEDGFEPSVPQQIRSRFRDSSPVSHDGLTVSRPGTESSNPSPSSAESAANRFRHHMPTASMNSSLRTGRGGRGLIPRPPDSRRSPRTRRRVMSEDEVMSLVANGWRSHFWKLIPVTRRDPARPYSGAGLDEPRGEVGMMQTVEVYKD